MQEGTAVPSWSQAGGDDVLHSRDRFEFILCLSPSPPIPGEEQGRHGSWGLGASSPGAAAQRAWALLQLLQRCKTTSSTGSSRARPSHTLGPSPACNEASRDGAGRCHSGQQGGSTHPHQRECHPVVRDGPPSTSSQTRTQQTPSPGISHVEQPQASSLQAARPGSPRRDRDRVCSPELHKA